MMASTPVQPPFNPPYASGFNPRSTPVQPPSHTTPHTPRGVKRPRGRGFTPFSVGATAFDLVPMPVKLSLGVGRGSYLGFSAAGVRRD